MKGVVFQISDNEIATMEDQNCPKKSKLERLNQGLTNPESGARANRHANADTTVMMPYGTRIEVRTIARPTTMRCITMANAKPMTSSTATVMTVIRTVTPTSRHHRLSVRITW